MGYDTRWDPTDKLCGKFPGEMAFLKGTGVEGGSRLGPGSLEAPVGRWTEEEITPPSAPELHPMSSMRLVV